METLSLDIYSVILDQLNLLDIRNLAMTCRNLAEIIGNEKIWKYKVFKNYGEFYDGKPAHITMKQYYYRLENSQEYETFFPTKHVDKIRKKEEGFRLSVKSILTLDSDEFLSEIDDFCLFNDKLYVVTTQYEFGLVENKKFVKLYNQIKKIYANSSFIALLTTNQEFYILVNEKLIFIDDMVVSLALSKTSAFYVNDQGALNQTFLFHVYDEYVDNTLIEAESFCLLSQGNNFISYIKESGHSIVILDREHKMHLTQLSRNNFPSV